MYIKFYKKSISGDILHLLFNKHIIHLFSQIELFQTYRKHRLIKEVKLKKSQRQRKLFIRSIFQYFWLGQSPCDIRVLN